MNVPLKRRFRRSFLSCVGVLAALDMVSQSAKDVVIWKVLGCNVNSSTFLDCRLSDAPKGLARASRAQCSNYDDPVRDIFCSSSVEDGCKVAE